MTEQGNNYRALSCLLCLIHFVIKSDDCSEDEVCICLALMKRRKLL